MHMQLIIMSTFSPFLDRTQQQQSQRQTRARQEKPRPASTANTSQENAESAHQGGNEEEAEVSENAGAPAAADDNDDDDDDGGEPPHETVAKAKVALETIARLYYLRHGFAHTDMLLMALVVSCGFMVVEGIARSVAEDPAAAAAVAAAEDEGVGDLDSDDAAATSASTSTDRNYPAINEDSQQARDIEREQQGTERPSRAQRGQQEQPHHVRPSSDQPRKQKEHLEGLRSSVVLMAKGLYEQGQNQYLARATFQLLTSRMRAEELRDVWRYARVQTDDDDDDDGDGEGGNCIGGPDLAAARRAQVELDARQPIKSEWPIGADNVAVDPEERRLTVLMKKHKEEKGAGAEVRAGSADS
ncbi:uncharacterized protein B0I36DRAFT_135497 [Microdochium trichocladiopsis]|uniref:Uncharacterized protein n=1 Tax=Microdochium trichocladiopsis TaxID=1682393 RepID=A0A9P8Y7Y1_9PEZI|nr:uncharacterized protein B0I36DRAFT_135497 [Microdochium trichocladiopsis]KAH7029826.1 hypothetical protein B0I36DRAFT_135497 [Microdochium trichocladiopsis]